ncbi:hypothetical protein [Streptacidiphilus sp. PAMC 29251]
MSALAQQILDRITADPDAFTTDAWFTIQTSHAIWPEDHIDGNDVRLGLAAWACHLSGWYLTRDDMGQPYAYQLHDDDDHRDLEELAVELLGLDSPDVLANPDRDAVIAELQRIAST